MMQTLRKNMKHILTVVLLSFLATIVFSWGMGGFRSRHQDLERGVIGVIDGQKILYTQFSEALEREIAQMREESGVDELPEYQLAMVRDKVWQTFERDILLAHEVKRRKIQATNEEIVFFMRYTPPEFIRNREEFQTDGKFDMAKYHEALRNPAYFQAWIPIENHYRNIIPVQKLQQWVLASARVSDEEALAALKEEHERVNVRYLFFDPRSVDKENLVMDDQEITSYYQAHRQEFKQPEERKIRYVSFDLYPSREDTLQTIEECETLLEEIRNGADFAELAKQSSQDPSAKDGGDLGFFGRGTMVKPFEEAAFETKVGSIVGPVKTPFGVHLIKVIARKVEKGDTQIHAAHILLKYRTSLETRDRMMDAAESFSERVQKSKKKPFASIAEEEGYQAQETPFFRSGDFVPQLGIAPRVNYLAFREKKGWVSKPVKAGERLVVFQIADVKKEQIQPLETVKETIRSRLETEKRKQRAEALCRAAWERVKAGVPLEQIAQEEGLRLQETGFFSLKSTVPFVGRDPAFIGTAFRTAPGAVSGPVSGSRGFYLLQVLEKTAYTPPNLEAAIAEKKAKLLEEKKNVLYTAWYGELKSRAKIKDYRKDYF